MSKKILTDDVVYKAMALDGIEEELYAEDARKHMLNIWGASFDVDSSWAEGHEDVIVYTEATADGYDVYIFTEDHDGKININDDLFYYVDGQAFMERALDTLYHGGSVWIDNYVADDISTEIDEAFETAYQEWYEEKFEEYQNELINDGYELHEDHK